MLQATAGLIGGALAIDTADRAEASDDDGDGDGDGVRCAEASEVPTDDDSEASNEPTEHAPGTVDAIHLDTHHEPGLMVVCLDDGRQVSGSPDTYHIGEGDRVTARVRDGRLIGVSLREDETAERREQASDQLEGVADR